MSPYRSIFHNILFNCIQIIFFAYIFSFFGFLFHSSARLQTCLDDIDDYSLDTSPFVSMEGRRSWPSRTEYFHKTMRDECAMAPCFFEIEILQDYEVIQQFFVLGLGIISILQVILTGILWIVSLREDLK